MANTAILNPLRPAVGPTFTHNVNQLSLPKSSPDVLALEAEAVMARPTERNASRGHSILDGKELSRKHSSKRKRDEPSSVDDASSAKASTKKRKKRRGKELKTPSLLADQDELQSPHEPDANKPARRDSTATERPSLPETKERSKYYVVESGHKPGVYKGLKKKDKQVEGFDGAKWREFDTKRDAKLYFQARQAQKHLYAGAKTTPGNINEELDIDVVPSRPVGSGNRILVSAQESSPRTEPIESASRNGVKQCPANLQEGKYYAVARGRKPGTYSTWAACEAQVKGFSEAKHKKFDTKTAAESFMELNQIPQRTSGIEENVQSDMSRTLSKHGNGGGLNATEPVDLFPYSKGRIRSARIELQASLRPSEERYAELTRPQRTSIGDSSSSNHGFVSRRADTSIGYREPHPTSIDTISKQPRPTILVDLEPSLEKLKTFDQTKLLDYTLSIQVRLKETLKELMDEKIKSNNFVTSEAGQAASGASIVDLTTPPRKKQREPLRLEQTPSMYTNSATRLLNTPPSLSRHQSLATKATHDYSPTSEEEFLIGPPPALSPPRAIRGYEEPLLCPEQSKLVATIMTGRNVFYTGSAGCGKSTVLRAFVKRLAKEKKCVDIIAPTGRAALDVGGSTTWTYAGWTPNSMKETLATLESRSLGKLVWKRLKATHVLVIDEISMVENHHFERLNLILKSARGSDKPFGGVQLVVTGDFCQLPPVKPFQHCIQCGRDLRQKGPTYTCPDEVCPNFLDVAKQASIKFKGPYHDDDKWAFRSAAWKECNFEHRNLTDIHRQSDEVFIRILEKCRLGTPLSQEDRSLLLQHESETTNAVKLFPTLAEVKRVNLIEFEKLNTPTLTFPCSDQFDRNPEHENLKGKHRLADNGCSLDALKDHKFETLIELKKGMLVILLVNLSLSDGLVNGSQGEIVDFVEHTPECLPEQIGEEAMYKTGQIDNFIKPLTEKFWPVVRFTKGQTRTITAHCWFQELGDSKPYSRLSRTQIPLIAAWAMSIHKSQGMTLDRVIVDLGRSFEKGQMYVALSRARTLEGLKVESLNPKHCEGGGNEQVKEFLYKKFGIE